MSVFPQSRPRAVESVPQVHSICFPVFPSPSGWEEANAGSCTDLVTMFSGHGQSQHQDLSCKISLGKITKSYFAQNVTRICSLCAVWHNAGCHSLSLAFFDVVLPNVWELCRLCKLTDPSARNCSFQRKPPRTEMQKCFQFWRRLINKTVTLSRSELL